MGLMLFLSFLLQDFNQDLVILPSVSSLAKGSLEPCQYVHHTLFSIHYLHSPLSFPVCVCLPEVVGCHAGKLPGRPDPLIFLSSSSFSSAHFSVWDTLLPSESIIPPPEAIYWAFLNRWYSLPLGSELEPTGHFHISDDNASVFKFHSCPCCNT